MSAAAFQLHAWGIRLQGLLRTGSNQAAIAEAEAMCRAYADFIIQRSSEPLQLF